MKRPVRHDDLLRFRWPVPPFPDGTKIAYMVHQANFGKNGYDSTSGPRPGDGGEPAASSDENSSSSGTTAGVPALRILYEGVRGRARSIPYGLTAARRCPFHHSVEVHRHRTLGTGGTRRPVGPGSTTRRADYLVFEQVPWPTGRVGGQPDLGCDPGQATLSASRRSHGGGRYASPDGSEQIPATGRRTPRI